MNRSKLLRILLVALVFLSCDRPNRRPAVLEDEARREDLEEDMIRRKLSRYVTVRLTTDLSALSEKEKEMIPWLIKASEIMDKLFWYEAYGDKDRLLVDTPDSAAKRLISVNYGPWDRMDDNQAFIPGVGTKPLGANFYPKDMTKEEFEKSPLKDKSSPYTLIERGSNGLLISVPYHVKFDKEVREAAECLTQAASLAEDPGLKKYLLLRAKALLNDVYQESDKAWLDMKNNTLDVVIGPIENYEDKLFGYKTAHESYVLVKDKIWSQKLARLVAYLPELQRTLPVEGRYKKEKPGSDAQLNVYDAIYYAGDCNAGSKTIAINLPNDEAIQLEKGARRLQLKNVIQAKFEKIMQPLAQTLIDPSQQKYVDFEAFFANIMFHEIAHGLGVKNSVRKKESVREALRECHAPLEEGKADMLGLYMISRLLKKGVIGGDIKTYSVTFVAGMLRSMRFGRASAHGIANAIGFQYLSQKGAIQRNRDGTYRVDFDKMPKAVEDLSRIILRLQGDGDYKAAKKWTEAKSALPEELKKDLRRAKTPTDLVFEQGVEVLGL